MIFKLFCWVIEFRLKRMENKERLEYLVHRLAQELMAQGYEIPATPHCQHVSLWGQDFSSSIDVSNTNTSIELKAGLMK